MRDYVIAISRWAKSYRSDFSIIAMNGLELTEFLEKTLFATRGVAEPARNYLRALDGILVEAPFYGFEKYGEATNAEETKYILGYLERLNLEGLQYLAVDYTENRSDMDKARAQLRGWMRFITQPHRRACSFHPWQRFQAHLSGQTRM